jgi:dTDP-4-amino-4,6-dideoxygalactose transaminase
MFTLLLPFDQLGFSRNQFQQMMSKRGIAIGIHYPSIPSLSLYRRLGYRDDDYPNAARIGRETVTLPLFPTMADSDVRRVCDALRNVTAHRE